MKTKVVALVASICVIVGLDQVTKAQILASFANVGESVAVIENYFNITYVRNYGAAFGLGNQAEPGLRDAFFLLMPPVAMTIILFMLKTAPVSERARNLALSAVFAGALGNYIDRLRFGYVVDFLDFHYQGKIAWPAFNVADMAIVCGVCVLILLEFISPPSKSSPGNP